MIIQEDIFVNQIWYLRHIFGISSQKALINIGYFAILIFLKNVFQGSLSGGSEENIIVTPSFG